MYQRNQQGYPTANEPGTPANESARLNALHATGLLDTAAEQRFDRLTKLAADTLGAPIALISLVDDNRQWFKSVCGLDKTETSRATSFCSHAIKQPGLFVIEDALRDDRFRNNPLVTGEPHVRFYAGVPLRGRNQHMLGTLCVVDHHPRTLTTTQRQTLRLLGDIAEDEIRRGDALGLTSRDVLARIYQDPATGLPNLNSLGQAVDACEPDRAHRTVMLIRTALLSLNSAVVSIDAQNESATAMRRCADLIRGVLPAGSTVARGTDEELVALIPPQSSAERLPRYLAAIHDAIAGARLAGGAAQQLVVRSGASFSTDEPADYKRLMAQAGLALRDVLRPDVHSSFAICNEAIRQRLDRRADIHRRLQRAIEQRQLHAFAQPIIDVRTGRLSGAEMLCRWTDADLGPISPAEFVPLAEEWGLALPLTEYMFAETFRLRRQLRAAGVADCRLSINVPGFLLREQSLIDSVIEQLQTGKLDGAQIAIEITEHSFVSADETLLTQIERLRAVGLKFAVDDFGTGYASFGQLKSMPVDAVKLDRVFVSNMAEDPRDAAFVRSMQHMFNDLGLIVIAEGVETREQFDMLAGFGCPLVQGWLFDKALPADAFVARATECDVWPTTESA